VPVAGITSLRDHVVNGCVEGHCDCMYMVNTFRWDFAKVAALVAPRPLLISNTDKDTIFPLEGVIDIHRQVRHIYELYDAEEKLGLQITEGPHADTQELHIHAFRWFNRFFKQDTSMIEKTAVKFFEPEQLKVFAQLPSDELNTKIDQTFVPSAELPPIEDVLKDPKAWYEDRISKLRQRCFREWPDNDPDWKPSTETQIETLPAGQLSVSHPEELQRIRIHFESEPHVASYLEVLMTKAQTLETISDATMFVTDGDFAYAFKQTSPGDSSPAESQCFVAFTPRGVGPHAWRGNEAKQRQIRRRFQLIGTTADAERIWDIRRAIQILRHVCPSLKTPPKVEGEQPFFKQHFGQLVLLATLFETPPPTLKLGGTATDATQWPDVLNLTRTISPQELVALAAFRSKVTTTPESQDVMSFTQKLAEDHRWQE